MSFTRIGLIGWAVLVVVASAESQISPSQAPLMDRQREIALALSACPASVASKAGVYLLEKGGYVKARESQNGFMAIVEHSLPTAQEPHCMDAEGTRTLLLPILKAAELRAQGRSPEEIKRFVAEGFAKGLFRAPTRLGVDYMLSTENLLNNNGTVTHFPPHLMFYAGALTNADLGADGNGPAFVADEGSPQALLIVPLPPQSKPERGSAGKDPPPPGSGLP
jgi:hypothetical protein